MAFLEALGRFLHGQPVFQDSQSAEPAAGSSDVTPQPNAPPPADPTKTSVDERGYKIIPKIAVKNLKTRRDGNSMISTLWITNESEENVRIDSTYVASQKHVSQRELGPGQGHEFLIYRGRVKLHEHDSQAHIIFRLLRSDDLFQEEYHVEYNQEPDGVFTLEELHEDGPTRDI